MAKALSDQERALMDAYWRAANYLSVGQIYLYDNPLLKQPLAKEHIKPRLLGHWGTTPGLNFIYVHLNRVIKKHDLDMIYITGPGHGGPGLVANAYLEGTYSEVYPNISAGRGGHEAAVHAVLVSRRHPQPRGARDARARSTRAASSAMPLSHAYGAAFDNPDLIVACVVGDGEAETGRAGDQLALEQVPQPGDATARCCRSCTSTATRSPTRPSWPASATRSWTSSSAATATRPTSSKGDEPEAMHELMAATLDTVIAEIQRIKADARRNGFTERPRWPMIVLRTPKGWTCPKEIDGKRTEGYWRSHQVPMGEMHENPEHVRILEEWMKSYRPEELFDDDGRLRPELAELPPKGTRRMSANPHANGGAAAARPAAAGLPRLRRRGADARARPRPRPPASWASSCAT